MLHALLDADRGLFIHDNHGDVVSAQVFSPDHMARFVDDSPTTRKVVCVLFGLLLICMLTATLRTGHPERRADEGLRRLRRFRRGLDGIH